jgi:hypothetical protein
MPKPKKAKPRKKVPIDVTVPKAKKRTAPKMLTAAAKVPIDNTVP